MEEKEQIRIQGGWIIDMLTRGKGRRIERIQARLQRNIYLPIDTSAFTKDQWDMFHELCNTGRNITGEGAEKDGN